MNEIVLDTYNRITEFLRNNIDHQNKKIDYILYNEETKETYTLASDSVETAIEFTPHTNGLFNYVPKWDYNFDYYLYNYLEEGLKIGYMSDEVHYGIWNSINELWPKEIDCVDGVNYYVSYCKDNGITKEYLEKSINQQVPDIMKKFEKDDFEI